MSSDTQLVRLIPACVLSHRAILRLRIDRLSRLDCIERDEVPGAVRLRIVMLPDPRLKRVLAAEALFLKGGTEHRERDHAETGQGQRKRIEILKDVFGVLDREFVVKNFGEIRRGHEVKALNRREISAGELVAADAQNW